MRRMEMENVRVTCENRKEVMEKKMMRRVDARKH